MIDCRAHYNDRRQSGDQGPSLFPAGADQPTGHRPAPSTGIAELESRLCRAGGFGRSEHQALAVVGVVLVGIAITEHPLPLLLRFSVQLRQHQQLAQNGIIAQARATRKEKI
jgi:hypothetical protein